MVITDMGDTVEPKREISNSELYELINKKIDEKFEELSLQIKQDSNKIAEDLLTAKRTINQLKSENEVLTKRIAFLEKRARDNNIAVFGLHRAEGNPSDSWIEQLNSVLKADISVTDLANIYQPKNNSRAPVIFQFLSNFKKRETFKRVKENVEGLKANKVFVANDLCREEQQILKVLREKRLQAKARNQTAKIVGKTLIINGVKYTYADIVESETQGAEETVRDTEGGSEDFEDILESIVDIADGSQVGDAGPRRGKRRQPISPSPRTKATRSNKKKKH